MQKIVIVDYELGNINNIFRAFRHFKVDVKVSHKKEEIAFADKLILPGVGAFSKAMADLRKKDLIDPIKEYAKSGKHLMGICLGLQLLFAKSHEFGLHDGLALVEGEVVKLGKEKGFKVPFMGWSELLKGEQTWEGTILEGFAEKTFAYFVHSFYVVPKRIENILSYTQYGHYKFCSSIRSGNLHGIQFHPELSGKAGLKIIENFINL
ncbi:MAG: imidazole glycerol phosphate synthase subunit HisH [Candidatus Omnitrophica bacterium]|nr:imidazole glycerol phosphate synthase subunit HisH [Candidatus Omnitrophota bacterium]